MKYNICVVTGTRAEYGVLRPVLYRLKECDTVNLNLVVTGTHLSEKFGNTQNEIIKDGFNDFVRIPIPLDKDTKSDMAYSTGVAIEAFSNYFAHTKIDLLLVLGDRYEILAAAVAAHLMGIPIAHISGGDITEGAVDDAIRHCITKMSFLHFPGCEQSRQRIIQMGESPDRVFNVGEIGVENCLNAEKLTRNELAEEIKFPQINGKYAVVTFHPVTLESDTALAQVRELISAMDELKDLAYIITMANADSGGRAINNEWQDAVKHRKNWFLTCSLGMKKYLSAVKYSAVVIGNSSSGLIEAPALKVPTVNIGDRQKGRMLAKSVVCCKPLKQDIIEAVQKATSAEFKNNIRLFDLPFGDGTASKQIVEIILSMFDKGLVNNRKKFFDVKFDL